MVAGVVALLLQRYPNLNPARIKNKLKRTARDISTGTSANGDTASSGRDIATGYGLVDAQKTLEVQLLTTVRRILRRLRRPLLAS